MGQGEVEGAALIELGIDPDLAAMRFDCQLAKGQPDTGPFFVDGAVEPGELVEDALVVLWDDADSVVTYAKGNAFGRLAGG